MELKRRSRWHEFYNESQSNVVLMLEKKICDLKTTGSKVSLDAGLHDGFWNKFTSWQTSPSRKSLFCFCRALGLSIENISALYKKGYKPTHQEIAKWETLKGSKIQKNILPDKEFTQPELNVFENMQEITTKEDYDLHCINWLKSRGFKIQKSVTVTTFEEI